MLNTFNCFLGGGGKVLNFSYFITFLTREPVLALLDVHKSSCAAAHCLEETALESCHHANRKGQAFTSGEKRAKFLYTAYAKQSLPNCRVLL